MKPYKSIYKEAYHYNTGSKIQFKVANEQLLEYIEEQIDKKLKELEKQNYSSDHIYFKLGFSYKEIFNDINTSTTNNVDLENYQYKDIFSNIKKFENISKVLSKNYIQAGWSSASITIYETSVKPNSSSHIEVSVSLDQ